MSGRILLLLIYVDDILLFSLNEQLITVCTAFVKFEWMNGTYFLLNPFLECRGTLLFLCLSSCLVQGGGVERTLCHSCNMPHFLIAAGLESKREKVNLTVQYLVSAVQFTACRCIVRYQLNNNNYSSIWFQPLLLGQKSQLSAYFPPLLKTSNIFGIERKWKVKAEYRITRN